jgi:hypothetical protein
MTGEGRSISGNGGGKPAVNHDRICTWLGLSEATWPPTHYQLLDLPPGESNRELIEQRVHQRLDALRCYQCTHPEQATEAMNRLAQAMLCLTDPEAKRAYDLELGLKPSPLVVAETRPLPSRPPALPPPLPALPATTETVEQANLATVETVLLTSRDPLAWMYARASTLPLHSTPPPLPALLPSEFPRPEKTRSAPPPVPPPAERIDPVVEAVHSPEARTGLGTLRGILRRDRLTRQLLLAWERLGAFLEDPRRKVKLPEEEVELMTAFQVFNRLLRRFPPLFGSAGQPGHLVGSLAAQDIVPTFRSLQRGQRIALSRDWQAGHKLLTLYRAFLLDEFRLVRQLRSGPRFRRAFNAFLTDQPAVSLLLLGLVVLNVFVWTWLTLPHW